MHRLITLLVGLGIAAGAVAVAAPAAGTVAVHAAQPAASTVHAGVDDFSFSTYDADFYLDSDDDGRSTLRTVETFVAQFPETDQNRGIRRAIPLEYDGHPTDVEVESVVDQDGKPRAFEVEENDDGDFLVVTVRADDYVHGAQSYTFTYTQHNVTRYFADTNDDEFYWDSIGFDSLQSVDSATVRVHVPDKLSGALTGDARCYSGPYGSNTPCSITSERGDGETVFTTDGVSLAAHENVSVAVGFAPGTFVPRDDSYFGAWQGWAQLGCLVLALVGVGLAIFRRVTRLRDAPGRPTIVAEYTPPKEADIFTSAVLLNRTKRAAASGFVDLAVRGNLRIVEKASDSMWSSKPSYELQAIHSDGLNELQQEFYDLIFADQPDGRRELKKNDQKLGRGVQKFISSARSRVRGDGYYKRGNAWGSAGLALLIGAAAVGAIVFGLMLASQSRGGLVPVIPMGVSLLCVGASWVLLFRSPLTAKGAELRDYLLGVKLYLTVAEEERLRVLQSPEGAEKSPSDSLSSGQIVEIYEKLLPLAVLWGVEDEWAKVLGTSYENVGTQPAWYGGASGFNAGYFAASVGSFAAVSASSYSGSASSTSSSSSGGSGGGGFSGGGGGGGGVGGV
jgi:uncharacterized membrane protein YgcG